MLTLEIKNKIRKLSEENPNEEICGLLINSGIINEVFPCKNISKDKKNHFILDPSDYVRANNIGKILALWHTQENDQPSLLDNFNSSLHNIYSIIYCKKNNRFFIVEPKLKSYLNNEYLINVFDCYQLLRNYYKTERNIYLNDYPVEANWFTDKATIIFDNFKNEGFKEVDKEEMKRDDILCFGGDKNKIIHIGIYLGNNIMLHQPRDSVSRIETLNPHYLNKLQIVVRHKDIHE